jgi:uncharacterized membrane protein YuzA (DUF378 family)
MKKLHMLAFVLLVVGGLNWLLVAFNYNLVDKLDMMLGMGGSLAMIVYVLVGLSAVLEVVTHKNNCMHCVGKSGQSM